MDGKFGNHATIKTLKREFHCHFLKKYVFILFFLQAEVNYLGQFSHPNLVKLIGYCCEDDHRLLVYEYMASGSLEKHLFRSKFLMNY